MRKKILIVVAQIPKDPESMNWIRLCDAVNVAVTSDMEVHITALTELVFDISYEAQFVFDTKNNVDVSSYDYVIIRNVGKDNMELGISLAHYLAFKGIPFSDSYLLTRGAGKLACAILRLSHGLRTPRTIYAKEKHFLAYLRRIEINYPLIVKADQGKKGRNNFLVENEKELQAVLGDTQGMRMIVQEYIPNDGDYRALVLCGEISLLIKRTANGMSHLSNTSQGGTAQLEAVEVLSSIVRSEIIRSAEIEGLEVAGVDIMFDKETQKHYFLEVNRAPQIGTGAFSDEKIAAYAAMIERAVQ